MLISFLGLGIACANWLSLALTLVPTSLVLLYRIRVEEAALRDTLGADYERYCDRLVEDEQSGVSSRGSQHH